MEAHPPSSPTYNKPETPGIWMNFDNTVSIYVVIRESDDFESSAQCVFQAVVDAEERFPGWPRMFYLDVVGHRDSHGDFHEDFIELQQEFWFSTVAPFLTGFDLPLTGPLINPSPQRSDLPDSLAIRSGN